MSGFVATADVAADTPITNDGWWPDVDPQQVRAVQSFDGTVTDERLQEALVVAIGSVNATLDAWKQTQLTAGYETLADVPAPAINGESRFLSLYQRAVRCNAAAHILERYRNFDVTDKGQKRADDQTPSIDELRRDERWALRDIQGLPHSTVELI